MSKKHTLPDGFYKIPYSNGEYYIVKNNLIKRIIIENRNQSINSSGYIPGLWIDFVSISDYFTKNLVPLTDEEKVELL